MTSSYLMKNPLLLPVARPLCLIGFDCPHIMRDTLHQLLDKFIGLAFDLGPCCCRSSSGCSLRLDKRER